MEGIGLRAQGRERQEYEDLVYMYRIGKYSAGQKKKLKGVPWNHKLQSSVKDTREE